MYMHSNNFYDYSVSLDYLYIAMFMLVHGMRLCKQINYSYKYLFTNYTQNASKIRFRQRVYIISYINLYV